MLENKGKVEQTEEVVEDVKQSTEEVEKVVNKELLKAKIKHYGKYVGIGAALVGLGYLAVKALDSGDEIIEGVFEEIEIEE